VIVSAMSEAKANIWAAILGGLRADMDPEEFRRWFSNSSYASDSGDQISVWVPTAAEGRHISQNYQDRLHRELAKLGRGDTVLRFIATGYPDEDEEHEENA
jgi:hypothetical protein